jgi:hypothetical protein
MLHHGLSLVKLTSDMFTACDSLAQLRLKTLNVALKLPYNVLGAELDQNWSCLDLFY